MEDPVKNVLLAIADISGYTRFMTSDKMSLLHSQVVISELTQALIDVAMPALAVSKLEGDAVFMYAVKGDDWEVRKKSLGAILARLFEAFTQRMVELKDSNMCKDTCKGCSEVDCLRLKIVVHSGEALFHRIGGFNELSGRDVITVHRLLKNTINSSEYVLLTDAARNDVQLLEDWKTVERSERYESIGDIKTHVWYALEADRRKEEVRRQRDYSTLKYKLKNEYLKAMRILRFKLRPRAMPEFQNLPIE